MITDIMFLIFSIIILISTTLVDTNIVKVFLCVLCIIGYIVCIHYCETNIPAIEVYRGNTTLQITYEGDTPIDSTVVWKKSN